MFMVRVLFCLCFYRKKLYVQELLSLSRHSEPFGKYECPKQLKNTVRCIFAEDYLTKKINLYMYSMNIICKKT